MRVIDYVYWWLKTYCRHWAIPNGPDWQTLEGLPPALEPRARQYLAGMAAEGLVQYSRPLGKREPNFCVSHPTNPATPGSRAAG